MESKIVIEIDGSNETYGYELYNDQECVLMGDGYKSPEEIIKELNILKDALSSGLKNIIKE